jgi:integrase/recombinase XerD
MRWRSSASISGGRRIGWARLRFVRIGYTFSSGVSWGGFNQAVCALRFFFGVTLDRAAMTERIPYARKPQRLPVVLSVAEVARFLAGVANLKHRVALTTAYAAGLRVSEVVRLKIADIDSSRMLIRVEQGKGAKDRYVMLSPRLLAMLRDYWRAIRPRHWLFPGQIEDRHLDPSVLQAACRAAPCCGRVPQAGNHAHAAP